MTGRLAFEESDQLHLAPQVLTQSLDEGVQRVLDALGDAAQSDGYKLAFVTDWTQIADFTLTAAELAEVSRILGVPATPGDYLVEIAAELPPLKRARPMTSMRLLRIVLGAVLLLVSGAALPASLAVIAAEPTAGGKLGGLAVAVGLPVWGLWLIYRGCRPKARPRSAP